MRAAQVKPNVVSQYMEKELIKVGVVLLVLQAVLGFKASAQAPRTCLDRVSVGAWSNASGYGSSIQPPPTDASQYGGFPVHVELGADTVPEGQLLIIPTTSLQSSIPYRSWRVFADTLVMTLTDGYVRSTVRVRKDTENWTGIMQYRTDNLGAQDYDRPITLKEVACRPRGMTLRH